MVLDREQLGHEAIAWGRAHPGRLTLVNAPVMPGGADGVELPPLVVAPSAPSEPSRLCEAMRRTSPPRVKQLSRRGAPTEAALRDMLALRRLEARAAEVCCT